MKKLVMSAFLVLFFAVISGTAGWSGNGLAAGDVPDTVKSLTGTAWKMVEGFSGKSIYYFKENGKLTYTSLTGSFTNGTWKQVGNAVFMETNKHYLNMLGLINGDTIKGTAWNKHGREWKFKFSKIE